MNTIQKSLYSNFDYRYNLSQLEELGLSSDFIETIRAQAQSVACLVINQYLCKREGGWGFTDKVPTLAEQQEGYFEFKGAKFGECEVFRDECAPGFGSAFLVGKDLALTAAHCLCYRNSNELNLKLIDAARLVFGFHDVKDRKEYFFSEDQVRSIQIVAYQYFRAPARTTAFSEWTDWALLRLDKEVSYPPLPLNLTEKIADKIELYMLGHPNGLSLKFTYKGFVQGNTENDFFECNLDAFEGNSGSLVGNVLTPKVEGMLCDGKKDYEISINYQGTGEKRIQACHITKSAIGRNKVGSRFENCQRMHTLRHLVDKGLLNIEKIEKQENTFELIVQSLKECYKSRNIIPRLLENPLPIDEIYTELVLLSEEKKSDQTSEDHRIHSFENLRSAKESIQLRSLFEARGGNTPKQLLILGRAGIGKSILCQHIAHEWARGKLWKEKFDAIFWIPLRKLQNVHSAETAASVIFRLCCMEKEQKLYTKDISDYLKQNSQRILFVLDGLDEIFLEENSRQKSIVHELLQFPYWIVTSRPHAAHMIQRDATIENVGFASKSINFYLRKSFQENAETLIQKVRHNRFIFGICHIPINLELVSTILRTGKDLSTFNSMTSLYENLTFTLQKRFLEKIGRPEAWEWKPGDFNRDPQTAKIFELLETIAWVGMQERQLFFSFNTKKMEEIYYQYPQTERDALFTELSVSGFLQSTGKCEEILGNEYSFLHLTFQEFFAARHLVRLLEKNQPKAAKLIRGVKFDPRYKIVMWFVAGLLKNEGGEFESLNAFFEILDTPKDNVGFYSALLKVRCLEECGYPNRLQKLKAYEEEIQFWCDKFALKTCWTLSMMEHFFETFEISPKGVQRFLFSNLSSSLSNKNFQIRKKAVVALRALGKADSEFTIPLIAEALKDQHPDIRMFAADALGYVGQANPQFTIPLLIIALKDQFYRVSGSAAKSIGRIGQTNPQVVSLLDEVLKNHGKRIREFAMEVLGMIGLSYPNSVISLLLSSLNDHDSDVRYGAAKALAKIGQEFPQIVIPLLANALKDENRRIRGLAIYAFYHLGPVDPPFIFASLGDCIKDESEYVRRLTIEVLSTIVHINPQYALPLFVEALKDDNSEVSKAAVGALYKNKEIAAAYPDLIQQFLPLLADFMENKSLYVRESAVKVLGQIGQVNIEFTLPLLASALNDKNSTINKAAIAALGMIAKSEPQPTFPFLELASKSDNPSIREAAANALGKVRQDYAECALPLLACALNDKCASVRRSAVSAIEMIGLANIEFSLPLLGLALKDEDHGVKQWAASSLRKLGKANPRFIIPLLANVLKDNNNHTRDKAMEALETLAHEDPEFILPVVANVMNINYGYDIIDMMDGISNNTANANAANTLKKNDLSSYFKSKSSLLYDFYSVGHSGLLTSTPLSSLITCYKVNQSKQSVYLALIVIKCIEENLSIFKQDDSLCFYEKGKLCKVNFFESTDSMFQLEEFIHSYPDFIFDPSSLIIEYPGIK